jgi:protein tyrosine/serine phosphatase
MTFSRTKRLTAVSAIVLVVAATSCLLLRRTSESAPVAERPSNWATPYDINGVPNFHKVSEDLYRGGQPTAEGIEQLKEMGIKTIVNLRAFHSDRDEIGQTDIGYEHIGSEPWNVDSNEAKQFLSIVTDQTKTPVFVHCKYGADRTGFMCAAYRIAVCGWDKQAAIDEMVNGGFGFHPVWKNIIEAIEKTDFEKLRANIPHGKASIAQQ